MLNIVYLPPTLLTALGFSSKIVPSLINVTSFVSKEDLFESLLLHTHKCTIFKNYMK